MWDFTPDTAGTIGLFVKAVGVPIACLCLIIWVFFKVVSILIDMISTLNTDAKADRERFRSDYRDIERNRCDQNSEWLSAIKKIHTESNESIKELQHISMNTTKTLELVSNKVSELDKAHNGL